MSERKNFNTSKIARMSSFFPQAVIADNLIFLSGMAGIDPGTGSIVSGDFEDQARQCFQNIKIILEEAGSDLSNVVKTTIFMVTGNDFSIINKVYQEFFSWRCAGSKCSTGDAVSCRHFNFSRVYST